MILNIYSIYDDAAQIYGTPFFALNDRLAQRSFYSLSKDQNSTVYAAPEDFSLHWLGSFDDKDGKVSCNDHAKLIIYAREFKELWQSE